METETETDVDALRRAKGLETVLNNRIESLNADLTKAKQETERLQKVIYRGWSESALTFGVIALAVFLLIRLAWWGLFATNAWGEAARHNAEYQAREWARGHSVQVVAVYCGDRNPNKDPYAGGNGDPYCEIQTPTVRVHLTCDDDPRGYNDGCVKIGD